MYSVDTRSDRWFHGALRVLSSAVAGQQSTNGLHYALERFETQCAMEPLSHDGKRNRDLNDSQQQNVRFFADG